VQCSQYHAGQERYTAAGQWRSSRSTYVPRRRRRRRRFHSSLVEVQVLPTCVFIRSQHVPDRSVGTRSRWIHYSVLLPPLVHCPEATPCRCRTRLGLLGPDPRAALLAVATKVKPTSTLHACEGETETVAMPMVGLMTLTGLTAARSTAPNYCTSTCSRVLTDVKLGPMIQRTRCKVFFSPNINGRNTTRLPQLVFRFISSRRPVHGWMDGWMHLRFVTEDRESLLKGPDLKQGKRARLRAGYHRPTNCYYNSAKNGMGGCKLYQPTGINCPFSAPHVVEYRSGGSCTM
jgi:hypothetical protein